MVFAKTGSSGRGRRRGRVEAEDWSRVTSDEGAQAERTSQSVGRPLR